MAVSTSNVDWTYAELDQRSNGVAALVAERLGESPGPVALLMQHGAALVAAILGVLKAGGMYLALDPGEPVARLTTLLDDSQARLLLADPPNASLAESIADGRLPVLSVDIHAPVCAVPPALNPISPEAGAWLMYTSGSTGAPKGVWQNHRGFIHHTRVYSELIQLTPDDRLSLLTSFSLAASATPLFAALLNGATLCPFHLRSQGVERLAEWLPRQRITIYHSVPTVFRHLLRSAGKRSCLDSVRLVRLGGEAMLRTDVDACWQHAADNCRLMSALSSTETGLISAWIADRHTDWGGERIPVGQPVRGVEVLLVDEAGQPVERGVPGRILVRSAHLAQGYWNRPEETRQAFRKSEGDGAARLFDTGDWGRQRPDGRLEHLGRADQQVKIRGQRVNLMDVETALGTTGLVHDAAAVPVESPGGERRLVCYFVPVSGADASPAAFRQALRRVVPEHLIPAAFVPLPRLPQTGGGKLDRRALSALAPPPASAARHRRSPRDGIEKKLAVLWETVLGVSPVGRDDDFFDLGGASLQSAQVLARIEDQFNLALPPSTLAEHSTVERLAAVVADRALGCTAGPLVPLRHSTGGQPVFLIHGGYGDVASFGQLARRLPDRPVYGLQSVGLQGENWPLMSIDAMAWRYVCEVCSAVPAGPVGLVGVCMGGLIALEMARELSRLGRTVGLVGLVDTACPARGGRRKHWTKRLTESVRDRFRIWRWAIVRALGMGRRPRWLPAYRRFVHHMNGRARRAYHPVFYPGTITLFLADGERYAEADPRLEMTRWAKESQIIRVPGRREELFVRPAVDELARCLRDCLTTRGLLLQDQPPTG